MILIMCAIRDSAAKAFLRPFCVNAVGMAIRDFSDAVNDEKSGFHRHPEDYELFEIGSYDEESGIVGACQARSLGRGQDVLIIKE